MGLWILLTLHFLTLSFVWRFSTSISTLLVVLFLFVLKGKQWIFVIKEHDRKQYNYERFTCGPDNHVSIFTYNTADWRSVQIKSLQLSPLSNIVLFESGLSSCRQSHLQAGNPSRIPGRRRHVRLLLAKNPQLFPLSTLNGAMATRQRYTVPSSVVHLRRTRYFLQ